MARKSRKAPIADEAPVLEAAKFRVGIYTRLSNEATASRESDSLIHQRELCMEYLKDKPDMAVVETYKDNGFTGTNFYRDDFQRMVDDIHSGKINCVVVKDLSRFGRNYLEVDQYLNVKFPEWKVRFIAVLDHFDTAAPDKDGQLIIPFRNILNDYYSRDFSQKVRTAIRAKMRNGEFVGNPLNIPYGYLRDGENHTYRVNPETAPTLQRIFQMRSEGYSCYKIANTLNRESIPSPSRYLYLKGVYTTDRYAQTLWRPETVQKILNNTAYIGQRIHHKTETGMRGTNAKMVPPDQRIQIMNAHEPLVSQMLFDKVQSMNCKSKKLRGTGKRLAPVCDFRPALKNRIYCGDCGKRIRFIPSGHAEGQVVLYSRCSRYYNFSEACTPHSISMPTLHVIIQQALAHQIRLSESVQDAVLKMNSCENGKLSQLRIERQSLIVSKNLVGERKNQLLKDYMAQIINREEYFSIKEQYEAQSAALEEQLACVLREIDKCMELSNEANRWANILHKYSVNGEITNELIQALIERIDLHQQKKDVEVSISFRFNNLFQQVLEVSSDG